MTTDTKIEFTDEELKRRRGGRPPVPDELKKRTPRITVRFHNEDEIDNKINKPGEAVGLDRSEQLRRMVTFASENMPKDWGMRRDWTLADD